MIAVVWLIFLVPWFAGRNLAVEADEPELVDRLSRPTTFIQRSGFGASEDVEYELSTPLTRRAERRDIKQLAHSAAVRRRQVMGTLLLATLGLGIAAPFTAVAWWHAVVPGVLLLAFVAVARMSVRSLNARLDARLAALDECEDEPTIALEIPESLRSGGLFTDSQDSTELSVELSAPIGRMGALWDPIPVTAPTYLAKPLVPRTVRTIDLSAPEPTISVPIAPVVAEALPTDEGTATDERQRDAS